MKASANTKSKNWNMFAGETEYRCNFMLEFQKPFTLVRYVQDKFHRLRFHIKSYLIFILVAWIAFGIFGCGFSLRFAEVMIAVAAAYYVTVIKKARVCGRLILAIGELFFQIELFASTSKDSYILLFNLPTLFSNLLLVYVWYHHLAISAGLLVAKNFLLGRADLYFSEGLIIFLTTSLFGYMERLAKEDWVLFDSFKRAQKLYMKMVDKLPMPNFVVDSSGKILYQNSSAKELYAKSRKSKIVTSDLLNCAAAGNVLKEERGLLEMVHPDHRENIAKVLKEAIKVPVQSIDIPLLINLPANSLVTECRIGLDVNLINQGITLAML